MCLIMLAHSLENIKQQHRRQEISLFSLMSLGNEQKIFNLFYELRNSYLYTNKIYYILLHVKIVDMV
jgi:hypothetical protein